MSEPLYTIINGAAGGGRCRARADLALARLRQRGVATEAHFTEAPGHATELAQQAWQQGHRHFLAVGGDGTCYEILNGLLPVAEAERPVLGILPLGTGNSFLRDFDIFDEEASIEALARGNTRVVDAVRTEHAEGVLYYMNLLGIGFVAQVGALTNEHFKGLGHAGYAVSVLLRTLALGYPVDPLRLDHADAVDTRAATFLCFCNSGYTGGSMHMAPGADVTDGQLDVIRAGPMSRRRLVSAFPRIFKGTHTHLPEVEHGHAARIDFQSEREQPAMIDGEVRHLTLRSLQVVPGALEVIA
jgi:YegS/Rv2252/BmrU family lipid kinase